MYLGSYELYLISGEVYKTIPAETLTQQMNSIRLNEARPPGDTGFVYNLQQANAMAEEGRVVFYLFFLTVARA